MSRLQWGACKAEIRTYKKLTVILRVCLIINSQFILCLLINVGVCEWWLCVRKKNKENEGMVWGQSKGERERENAVRSSCFLSSVLLSICVMIVIGPVFGRVGHQGWLGACLLSNLLAFFFTRGFSLFSVFLLWGTASLCAHSISHITSLFSNSVCEGSRSVFVGVGSFFWQPSAGAENAKDYLRSFSVLCRHDATPNVNIFLFYFSGTHELAAMARSQAVSCSIIYRFFVCL